MQRNFIVAGMVGRDGMLEDSIRCGHFMYEHTYEGVHGMVHADMHLLEREIARKFWGYVERVNLNTAFRTDTDK